MQLYNCAVWVRGVTDMRGGPVKNCQLWKMMGAANSTTGVVCLHIAYAYSEMLAEWRSGADYIAIQFKLATRWRSRSRVNSQVHSSTIG